MSLSVPAGEVSAPLAQTGRLDSSQARAATIWRAGYLLIQGGLSVLLFAVLARVLGSRAFAAAAVAQGVLVLAQAVADLGLSQGAVTVLPARLAAEDDRGARKMLGGAALGFCLAATLAFFVCGGASFIVPGAARTAVLLIAPAAAVTVLVSCADGLLRAQGQFRRPVVLVTCSRLAAFAGVIGAAATGSAAGTSAAISLGTILGSIPASRVAVRYLHVGAVREMRWFLVSALPLALAQLTFVAAGRINTLILSPVSGVRAGAVFEAAWRLFQLGQYAAGALATGAAPFLADALGGKRWGEFRGLLRKVGAAAIVGGLLGGVALLAFGHELGVLFADSLGHAVGRALIPLALATPLAFLNFLLVTALAPSERYRRWILPASLASAVVNIGLVGVLADTKGARGGTIAAAAGTAVMTLVLLPAAARFVKTLGE
jgi:O-antigen/teichoic acid export membrane protein